MNVEKFAATDVKWGLPNVKNPYASKPLNVFIFWTSSHFSSKEKVDDKDIPSLSLERLLVTS